MQYFCSGIAIYPLNKVILFFRDPEAGELFFEYDGSFDAFLVDPCLEIFLKDVTPEDILFCLSRFIKSGRDVLHIDELILDAKSINDLRNKEVGNAIESER